MLRRRFPSPFQTRLNSISQILAKWAIGLLLLGYLVSQPWTELREAILPASLPEAHVALGDFAAAKVQATQVIQQFMQEEDIQGLSVAVARDQHLLWTQGFGFSDAAQQIPATPETLYRVGQLASLFTVTAALQLVEQGKLDLNRPLTHYLPEFQIASHGEEATPITILHLMTHHAGLPANHWQGYYVPSSESFLTQLAAEYTLFPPNQLYYYSNVGIALLGEVVARESGVPIDQYLTTQVLKPLDMHLSTFQPTEAMKPLVSSGFDALGKIVPPFVVRDDAAVGLYSNALELSRFMQMMFAQGQRGQTSVLSAQMVETMLTAQNAALSTNRDDDAGLGWVIQKWQPGLSGFAAGLNGIIPPFYSAMLIFPEVELGIVLLTNSSSVEVVNALIDEVSSVFLEAERGLPDVNTALYSPPIDLAPSVLKDYEGTYVFQDGTNFMVLNVQLENDQLHAQTRDQIWQLVPHFNRQFSAQPLLGGWLPVSDINHLSLFAIREDESLLRLEPQSGQIQVVELLANEWERLVGTRVTPVPIPPSWDALQGDYVLETPIQEPLPFTEFSIVRNKEWLLFELGPDRSHQFILLPQSDHTAIMVVLLDGMGPTLHTTTTPAGVRLRYSGLSFQRR